MIAPTPLQRLADLYKAARAASASADVHDVLYQHACELEKLLTPPAEKPAGDKP